MKWGVSNIWTNMVNFINKRRRKRKMASVTITGTVTDSAGATGNFSTVVTMTPVVPGNFTLSAVVTPADALAGTTRNLTVTPTGGTAPFTYAMPTATGITFTPVAGQPNQWTFVY